MFVLWIKKRDKATAKAEGITKGSVFAMQKAADEIRINETETDLQKEAFVNSTHLRLHFSILMSGTEM